MVKWSIHENPGGSHERPGMQVKDKAGLLGREGKQSISDSCREHRGAACRSLMRQIGWSVDQPQKRG